MVTVKLSEGTNTILTFDGAVLEIFKSQRLHVAIIDNIELLTDKHGHHKLRIVTYGGFPDLDVDEAAFPKVTKVIADVQKAKAEFKFD
jgi:hypothetical protein